MRTSLTWIPLKPNKRTSQRALHRSVATWERSNANKYARN